MSSTLSGYRNRQIPRGLEEDPLSHADPVSTPRVMVPDLSGEDDDLGSDYNPGSSFQAHVVDDARSEFKDYRKMEHGDLFQVVKKYYDQGITSPTEIARKIHKEDKLLTYKGKVVNAPRVQNCLTKLTGRKTTKRDEQGASGEAQTTTVRRKRGDETTTRVHEPKPTRTTRPQSVSSRPANILVEAINVTERVLDARVNTTGAAKYVYTDNGLVVVVSRPDITRENTKVEIKEKMLIIQVNNYEALFPLLADVDPQNLTAVYDKKGELTISVPNRVSKDSMVIPVQFV
jgi:hypothetical protein